MAPPATGTGTWHIIIFYTNRRTLKRVLILYQLLRGEGNESHAWLDHCWFMHHTYAPTLHYIIQCKCPKAQRQTAVQTLIGLVWQAFTATEKFEEVVSYLWDKDQCASLLTANKRKQERPNNGRGPRSKTVAALIIVLHWQYQYVLETQKVSRSTTSYGENGEKGFQMAYVQKNSHELSGLYCLTEDATFYWTYKKRGTLVLLSYLFQKCPNYDRYGLWQNTSCRDSSNERRTWEALLYYAYNYEAQGTGAYKMTSMLGYQVSFMQE